MDINSALTAGGSKPHLTAPTFKNSSDASAIHMVLSAKISPPCTYPTSFQLQPRARPGMPRSAGKGQVDR